MQSVSRPALWTILLFTSPPSPLPKVKVQYIQTVCGWEGVGGGGILSCVGDHILQEFTTLYLTRFRTLQNCLTTPEQKPRRGGGPQTDKHPPQSPFKGQFFQITTFDIAFDLPSVSSVPNSALQIIVQRIFVHM
jgi:hypothetical protein